MYIEFRTTQLEKCYRFESERGKKWGTEVARRYVERVNILKAANSIADVRALKALACHSLKGDRKDQHAVKLTRRWRLIFTLHGDGLRIVRIEEVSKHYGD